MVKCLGEGISQRVIPGSSSVCSVFFPKKISFPIIPQLTIIGRLIDINTKEYQIRRHL